MKWPTACGSKSYHKHFVFRNRKAIISMTVKVFCFTKRKMWVKWSASKLAKAKNIENKGFNNKYSSSLISRNHSNAKHFAAILQHIQVPPNAGLCLELKISIRNGIYTTEER